jgi:oxaloacetate decarboxylase alpha subunit
MAEGATVKAGDTIVMIESMKMELEVKATANGTVHYLASAGAAIQAGQPLAEIK